MSDQGKSPSSPGPEQDRADRSRSPSPRHEDTATSSPRARSRSPAGNREGDDDAASANGHDTGAGDESANGDGRRGGGGAPSGDIQNPGNNVYVANLPHRLGQSEMEEIFGKYGRIEKCEVIIDPVTRESRGFAFVTYEDVRDAEDAVREMNGKELQGRRLRVEIAKRRRGHEKTPGKYLGPRLASSKYGRDGRDDRGRDPRDYRDRSFGRPRRSRSRSRSRDRYPRRYDDRDRYDRPRYDDRSRRRSYDRYDDRRPRR